MEKVHPQVVLEELLAATHRPERQAVLRKLHAICEGQAKGSVQDLSVATIGKMAEAMQVLKKKTLSNKSSAPLVTLIEAWANFVGRDKVSPPDVARSAIQSRLTSIPDPALRFLVQSGLAERDKLQNQLNLLKAATTLYVDRGQDARGGGHAESLSNRALAGSELSALMQVLEPRFLADEGWVEGSQGEICDVESGRRIFPKGFLSALRRICGQPEGEASPPKRT